jgi:hypothetical protein
MRVATTAHFKIWFSKNKDRMLGYKHNEARLVRHRALNPNHKISLIIHKNSLSPLELVRAQAFCDRNQIQLYDISIIEEMLKTEIEKKLLHIARMEILYGNPAAASDIVRLLARSLGIYSDLDIEIDFRKMPEEIEVGTFLLNCSLDINSDFAYHSTSEAIISNDFMFFPKDQEDDKCFYDILEIMLKNYKALFHDSHRDLEAASDGDFQHVFAKRNNSSQDNCRDVVIQTSGPGVILTYMNKYYQSGQPWRNINAQSATEDFVLSHSIFHHPDYRTDAVINYAEAAWIPGYNPWDQIEIYLDKGLQLDLSSQVAYKLFYSLVGIDSTTSRFAPLNSYIAQKFFLTGLTKRIVFRDIFNRQGLGHGLIIQQHNEPKFWFLNISEAQAIFNPFSSGHMTPAQVRSVPALYYQVSSIPYHQPMEDIGLPKNAQLNITVCGWEEENLFSQEKLEKVLAMSGCTIRELKIINFSMSALKECNSAAEFVFEIDTGSLSLAVANTNECYQPTNIVTVINGSSKSDVPRGGL